MLKVFVSIGLLFYSTAFAVNITVPNANNYGDVLRGTISGRYTPVATSTLFKNASSINTGLLTFTDWTTFNNKQAAGDYITEVTVDSPLSGLGTSASHLTCATCLTSTAGDWTGTFDNQQGSYYLDFRNLTNTGTTSLANLTVVGTIATGVWQGTDIADDYIASAATWNAKESGLTFDSPLSRSVNTITCPTCLTASGALTGTFDGQDGTYYLNARNLTEFGTPFWTFFNGTTTDALTEGATNKYYTAGAAQADCATITGGAGLCDGIDNTGGAGANVDNVIYLTTGGTKYYVASSTATDNLSFRFNNGILSYASSTFMGTLTVGALTATSSINFPSPFTLGGVSVLPTGTELNFVDGVTSAIQTQIDSKLSASGALTGTFDGEEGTAYHAWGNLTSVPAGFSDGVDDTGGGGGRGTTTITLASGQNTRTNVGSTLIDVASGGVAGTSGGTRTIVDWSGYTKARCSFGLNAIGTGSWEVRIVNVGVTPNVFICGYRATVAGIQGVSTTTVGILPTASSTLRVLTNSVTTTDDPVIHNVSIQLEP